QSMAEVAQALAPYIAASSPSFQALRNTSTWHGGQLATMTRLPPRRRVLPWLVAGAAVLSLLVVGLIGFATGWFHPNAQQAAQHRDASPSDTKTAASPADSGKSKSADEPNVLTVSQKPEDGGKYRTIGEALDKVAAGQTIRVVDAATYREQVLLNRPSSHNGVALEAVRGATLEITANGTTAFEVSGVTGVTIRGFLLRAAGTQSCALVYVHEHGTEVLLERLDMGPGPQGGAFNGIEVQDVEEDDHTGRPSVTVRDCVFRKAQCGINVIGIQGDYSRATPVRGLAARSNEFIDCSWGVTLKGSLQHVQVIGNRFRGCLRTACQLEQLLPETNDVLVANNTAVECNNALRVWDAKIRTSGVRCQNNLSLGAPYPDALFFDSGGSPLNAKGFGDSAALLERWSFRCNWRETKRPAKSPSEPDGWIPPGKEDVLSDKIEGVNRDPKSPDFLRPDKNSPLATQGAGTKDGSLPAYIGALPCEGTPPWDWDRTWRARVHETGDKK
ncbi:MAG TPA: hypothetical protein VMS17_12435, partial [Gemmataceae bacterium]|nr:hypothetical protein [Gemmataceae bacterium]